MVMRLFLVYEAIDLHNMIIVNLGGGLGNQMFQYAFGRKMSIKNNDKLLLDTSVFGVDTNHENYRALGLRRLCVTAPDATPEQILEVKYPYGTLITKIKYRLDLLLKRRHAKFEPYMLWQKGNLYLDGYWQTEKYFKDIREVILKDFTLKEPFSAPALVIADNIRADKNSVSLHVRRGDYVKDAESIAYYGSHCNQEYYEKSLKYLSDKKGDLSVYVFSDDIEWVKNNIRITHKTTYISEHAAPDYERMQLMSVCEHHIIANSSFSWWGAWLNNKPGKIVIGPSLWIPGSIVQNTDILPDDWVRM